MELASIIINSCLSVIAIVISIITIIRQTKEQKLQNTIQLYDRRINVYCYFMDIYKMSGYLAGFYGFKEKDTFSESFAVVKEALENKKLDSDIYNKILNMHYESDKMRYLTTTLFEKELSIFMCSLMKSFSDYVFIIRLIREKNRKFTEKNYDVFVNLYLRFKAAAESFKERINKYISLVDVKRD